MKSNEGIIVENQQKNNTFNSGDVRHLLIFKSTFKLYKYHEKRKYLTREEVSRALSVTLVTLYNWNKSGYLKAVKIGKAVRYKKSDIDKLLIKGNHGKQIEL